MNAAVDLMIGELAQTVQCARCGRNSPKVRPDCLECLCGARYAICGRTIELSGEMPESERWQRQQLESIHRYQAHTYNADPTLPVLFGGFIAATVNPNGLVVDVGCGIASSSPEYVRQLRLAKYVGVEPLSVAVARDYWCLSGTVAERMPLQDGVAEAVIFATSLDHVTDLRQALSEAKRVLAPSGAIYLWIGVHDPEVIAGSRTLRSLLYRGSKVRRALKFVGSQVILLRTLIELWRRRRRLARGLPLDPFHTYFFSLETFPAIIRTNDLEIRRQVLVPGTNSLFLEVATTGTGGARSSAADQLT